MLVYCPNCHSRQVIPIDHPSTSSAKANPVFSQLSLQHIIQCAALGAKLGKRCSPRHPVIGSVSGAVIGGVIGGLTTVAILPITLPFMQPHRPAYECQDCGYQFDPLQHAATA